MGAAALPAVLGAGGLFLQSQANNDAKKAANKATGNQKELIKRQTMLFDTLVGLVQDADKAGQFDPQKQLDQLQTDTSYYANQDMGNSAASARALGYRPGDTAPLKSIRSIDSKYRLQYGQMANEIRRNAFADKLSAYRGIDASSLNPGIQVAGQQAQSAQSRVQNPANAFMSMMPYMMPQKPSINVGASNPGWFAANPY